MADFSIEKQYSEKTIMGIDEAGRGPLAGPVVVAGVIAEFDDPICGITDSKKISAKRRGELFELITKKYQYSVAVISPQIIDEINILQATIKGCEEVVKKSDIRPDIALVDGNMKFDDKRFVSIIKGDLKSYSIAAASIVAKVTRDRIMQKLALKHPEYHWENNSGYGTAQHLSAIAKHGKTIYHRQSFKSSSCI